MTDLITSYEFELPKGYRDKDGVLHKEGVMRLATAMDEIIPLKDARVKSNPAYHIIILLSRVIESLGTLEMINTKVIEDMFSTDIAYLQEFYNKINSDESRRIHVSCPHCQSSFEVEPDKMGE